MRVFFSNHSFKTLIWRIPHLFDRYFDPLPSLPIACPPSRRFSNDSPPIETTGIVPHLQSKVLQPTPSQFPENEEREDHVSEFLSRFVWAIRPKLLEAFPGLPRKSMNAMLLLICQRVVGKLEGGTGCSSVSLKDEEFSPDLWQTIMEVSSSVHEAMRRDKMREEMKKYLHCDEVKQMCRFASDIGIRGDLLRELRFKWAREKLEDVEFYQGLDRIRESAREEAEGLEKKGPELLALPERKGRIKYKIYGLDLSDPVWEEVAEKTEEAERHYVLEEPQLVEGKCKRVEDQILALDARNDDPAPLLTEWKELLGPKKVDWYALLERITGKNPDLYFKVLELMLTEESFEANVRDYSRLIDAYSMASDFDSVERILQKMTDNGIVPDVLISATLVNIYSKTGNLERAKTSFENLIAQGFKPDVKTYNLMIMTYVKAGVPLSGESLIKEMESRDIKPTKEMYMELLRAYSELGMFEGAQRMVNAMMFSGIPLFLESGTLLVEAYSNGGEPNKARWHFDNLRKSGVKPDDRCIAAVVRAYKNKNLLYEALDLLLALESGGFLPELDTYSVLVDWMCRLQLVDEAEQLLSKISEKGDIPFELHVSLCDMYSRAQLEAKARKSLKILEAKKQLLRADQLERVASSLLDGKLVEEAHRICGLMQQLGFSPSEKIQVAIRSAQSISQSHHALDSKQDQNVPRRWQSVPKKRW